MSTAGRLWQVLMGLAALAALATLFGPADRWWGVDIGATGASLFFLSVAGLITLLALRGNEVFPEDWSLMERRSWLGLLATTLVLLTFAKFIWILAQVDPVPTRIADLPGRQLIHLLVTMTIAWGISARLLGRGAGPITEDERDLRLRLAADGAGDLALSLAIVGSVVLLVALPAEHLAWWLNPLVLGNVLIASLIARSLIENLAMVALYARARR
jgi:hypothetical protein